MPSPYDPNPIPLTLTAALLGDLLGFGLTLHLLPVVGLLVRVIVYEQSDLVRIRDGVRDRLRFRVMG